MPYLPCYYGKGPGAKDRDMTDRPRNNCTIDDAGRYLNALSDKGRRPQFSANGLPKQRVESFSREEKLAALALSKRK